MFLSHTTKRHLVPQQRYIADHEADNRKGGFAHDIVPQFQQIPKDFFYEEQ